jgi:hypothetical protein
VEKINGMSYGYMASRGDYRCERGIQSQDLMLDNGFNWIVLPVVNNQTSIHSSDIQRSYNDPTDRDLKAVIEKVHSKGVKVCLKIMLNSLDRQWRAHIGSSWPKDDSISHEWDWWFRQYTDFILYFCEFAEETGCEMVCIGCEMLGTEHRETDWTTLIRRVRACYHGKVVYNTNHDAEENSHWFDQLDYIGTSAYYSVGVNCFSNPPTTDENGNVLSMRELMLIEWQKIRERLDKLAERKKKQIIFMEVGCRSAHTCSLMPWDYEQKTLAFDDEEQALFYETLIETFKDDKHWAGVFWWDWPTFTYDTEKEAKTDVSFNIHLKKAENVVKEWNFK